MEKVQFVNILCNKKYSILSHSVLKIKNTNALYLIFTKILNLHTLFFY
ncbi:MAG: hypothetical protein BAJALOKI3v1_290012 [Promethearchaeota archaeon]|nr:MAG: hypothetical protein BAJALOKI3v1_290012 [Candidatus Lokiarchaeota archaeon]